jgi:hypothetical protein
MFSKRSREGELMVDHGASPGLPKDFFRNIGLDSPATGEGKRMHMATLTCCHCGGVYLKNPERAQERGYCQKCDDYACDNCMLLLKLGHACTPHLKTLDQAEQRAYRVQQNELTTRFTLIKE